MSANTDVIFDTNKEPYRGWWVRATEADEGDALIEVFREQEPVRSFRYPAYRVWNIVAHFREIVDGELEDSAAGYDAAHSNGLIS